MRRRPSPKIPRRSLLRGAGAMTALGASPLGAALAGASRKPSTVVAGYGPLRRDPKGLLHLPPGFLYQVISRVGTRMSDGFLTPGLADGMHAFPGGSNLTRLLRNHELNPDSVDTAFAHLPDGPPRAVRQRMYDAGLGKGGVTTLVFNTRTQTLKREFLSLAGTLRNCAGGATPWGSWVSCEEILLKRGQGGALEDHGYNFEVPSGANDLVEARALKAMGRFNHEAVGVGPASGVVYQTEDRADGLFYRFLPDSPGDLRAGGRLQALVLQEYSALFTGNWHRRGGFPLATPHPVRWIDLQNVDSPGDDLRYQGRSRGAAAFARGEGVAVESSAGGSCVWFVCTAGGQNKRGQLWCYRPSAHEGTARETGSPGTLELFAEPNDSRLLNHGDNICVAPHGDLIVCEDNTQLQRLMGVTRDGGIYPLAVNARGDSEFAGATFSPDETTLFVNLQNPGLTFAITGPWKSRVSAPA